jgi:pyridoxine 5-phosphate synthase
VTLVPDPPDAITSNAGWDTIKYRSFLTDVIGRLQSYGIRTSIFIDTNPDLIEGAASCGTDRVELYTEPYASLFPANREKAVHPFASAAEVAHQCGLGLNAGHDLNMENLRYFLTHVNHIEEVSIGHALIADALYYGLQNTVKMYLKECK